jgi:hypothetical protein
VNTGESFVDIHASTNLSIIFHQFSPFFTFSLAGENRGKISEKSVKSDAFPLFPAFSLHVSLGKLAGKSGENRWWQWGPGMLGNECGGSVVPIGMHVCERAHHCLLASTYSKQLDSSSYHAIYI